LADSFPNDEEEEVILETTQGGVLGGATVIPIPRVAVRTIVGQMSRIA
jgi:hypothetical protein